MARLIPLGFAVAIGLAGCGKPPAARQPVTVSGQVLDLGGKPLALKVVSFNPQEADQKNGASGTDAQGQFTLQLVPGKYHVTLAEAARAGSGGVVGTEGGVAAPEKGGRVAGIPNPYRNANETPWQITIPDGGKSDLKLQIGK